MSSRRLNLWKQALGKVPDSVWDQTDLETLVLADNHLDEVSERIGRLQNLVMLDLGHNQLSTVPAAIGDLPALSAFLYLHDNRMTVLPPSFAWLPDTIGKLSRLRELHLRDNRLTGLPESLGELKELRHIDLRGNPLTTLPDTLAALPRLEKIDLRWVDSLTAPAWLQDLEAAGCLVYL